MVVGGEEDEGMRIKIKSGVGRGVFLKNSGNVGQLSCSQIRVLYWKVGRHRGEASTEVKERRSMSLSRERGS